MGVHPVYECDAQKFRETCRSRTANFEECPSCLCEESCPELDNAILADKLAFRGFWDKLMDKLVLILAVAAAVELFSILFCYQCCPAQCCRSTYWCLCCFPICPWCCLEEYCRICPCCRPCLVCCLPNCCGNPPKKNIRGIELALR